MVPITVDKFVDKTIKSKNNSDLDKRELKESLLAAADRKKNGTGCMQCGQPIWAIGSGVTGLDMCFTCTTGEADHSDDYELDTVCFT